MAVKVWLNDSRHTKPGSLESNASDAGPPYRQLRLFMLCCAQLWLSQELPVLIELRLENYAVIDNLVVEFGQGLNLLTGETGAAKST